jgi:pimeloyl-ACP methyl ester carboxylesterase
MMVIGFSSVLVALMAWAAWALIRRSCVRRRRAAELAIRTPNGVEEASFVRIGGIDQWVQARGEDRDNPVLLVLHGGMAMTYVPQTEAFRAWERHFTVVQWDRRGVGKTYGRNGAKGSGEMTLERIAEDGLELCDHLRERFGKRKVLLMGHSMGSLIGMIMAARGPDRLHAYLATEQIVAMAPNEALTYRMTLDRLREEGLQRDADKLERLGPPPYPTAMRWGAKQAAVERADPAYGLQIKAMGQRLFTSPACSLMDVVHFFGANAFCAGKLFQQWMAFDGRKLGARFGSPIVVIQGEDDLMAPTSQVQAWLDGIEAPSKRLVALKAGHLSMFTAPEAFLDALITHVRPLAAEAADQPQAALV